MIEQIPQFTAACETRIALITGEQLIRAQSGDQYAEFVQRLVNQGLQLWKVCSSVVRLSRRHFVLARDSL